MPDVSNPSVIEEMLTEMFSPEWLRETASRVGLVKRNRKVDPVALFWVLILGFGVGVQRTLASLRRSYETASAKSIVPSAFYDRFSPQLVVFLRECLTHGMAQLAKNSSLTLCARLREFKDLVVADGTLISLHKNLARQFPGSRSEAQLKIHSVISVTANGPKSVTFHAGNTAEVKTIRIGPWVKDTIVLFDLGYFKYQLFSRITRNGGHFISRLKKTANPTIVSVLRQHRGRSIDVSGKSLKEILPQLKRQVVDVLVEVSFKRRCYNGVASPATETYRLVGLLNKDTGEYHLYLTSISPEQLSAEDVALLYGARWAIELVFKELKRVYQLDVLNSAKSEVVEALVLVAMLTLVVSRRILNFLRQVAPDKAFRLTNGRWAEMFHFTSGRLMENTLRSSGITEDPFLLMLFYLFEAPDPHVNRKRLMDPWVEIPSFPEG
ncbi:MAG: IS4 family transposase [Bacillota bacterium]|jgi:IS4 transposase